MRLVIGILAFVGAGATAIAEPPSPTPTQSATTTATPPASTSGETTAAISPREKILKNKGYRLEMRNGQKVYCRSEEVLGSRLGRKKTCGSVEELEEREHLSREVTETAQRSQLNPTGK
jgi:hypothetical protein